MKITFVVPFARLTGGMRVVCEYANHLTSRGHVVTVVHPMLGYTAGITRADPVSQWYRRLRNTGTNVLRHDLHEWFRPDFTVKGVPWVGGAFLPDADFVVATSWPTAYSVAGLPPRKGRKVYLIQHYELWSGPKDLVDATYRMPLHQIVVASWLKRLLEDRFAKKDVHMITNAVNMGQFHNPNRVMHSPRRILMQYSTHKWKGLDDGIKAFDLARAEYSDMQLVMFGTHCGRDVPDHVEFHHNPAQERLREIYSSCDIFMAPSWVEGCQLPPMEAMACKCAVVATNVGGVPDYAISGETALTAEPGDSAGMANCLLTLLNDEQALLRVSVAGFKHIGQFTWEAAAAKLEAVLERI